MESLKNTLYIVAVIAISTGIIDLFTNSDKLNKYTKYVTSLVVIISLLHPFGILISQLPEALSGLDNSPNSQLTENNPEIKKALDTAITYDIESYFSIPQNIIETDIVLLSNADDTLVNSITIKIKNKDYNRYCERIEYYIKSNYGCEVKVLQSTKE